MKKLLGIDYRILFKLLVARVSQRELNLDHFVELFNDECMFFKDF